MLPPGLFPAAQRWMPPPGFHPGHAVGHGGRTAPGTFPAELHRAGLLFDSVGCDLRHRLWPNDGDLPDDEPRTDPVLHLREPGAEPYRPELAESAVCTRLPGLPHYDLYRHLRGAGPDGGLYGQHHRIHLGRHGIYGASVLCAL